MSPRRRVDGAGTEARPCVSREPVSLSAPDARCRGEAAQQHHCIACGAMVLLPGAGWRRGPGAVWDRPRDRARVPHRRQAASTRRWGRVPPDKPCRRETRSLPLMTT